MEAELQELLEIQSEMRELIVGHVLNHEPLRHPGYVEELLARSDEWWRKQDYRGE